MLSTATATSTTVATKTTPTGIPIARPVLTGEYFLAVTALYCVLNVFPIIDVPNVAAYVGKILGVIVLTNLVGAALYAASSRRAS